jgi:hypothetical protein
MEHHCCLDLCLDRMGKDLQAVDVAGFLRELTRVAHDYNLSINHVETCGPGFHILSRGSHGSSFGHYPPA